MILREISALQDTTLGMAKALYGGGQLVKNGFRTRGAPP
jgi:hypothetical protein